HVTEFPPELQESATSLHREGIPDVSCAHLAERIADALESLGAQQDRAGFHAVLHRWRRYDLSSGRTYEAMTSEGTVIGVAEGIDAAGALLLRLADGSVQSVTSASALRENAT